MHKSDIGKLVVMTKNKSAFYAQGGRMLTNGVGYDIIILEECPMSKAGGQPKGKVNEDKKADTCRFSVGGIYTVFCVASGCGGG